jgi:hypothetical protein
MSRISAHEHSILRVFSDEYAFCIPNYQRPYRWGIDQAEQLLKDIYDSAQEAKPFLQKKGGALDHVSPYFLGSIVMIKVEDRPEADVVDGQQRLTTLSLLLAALRATLPEEEAQDLRDLLFEKGSKLKGTKDRCRLTLRDRDQGFYQNHVLEDDKLGGLADLTMDVLPEPQTNIVRNTSFFVDELQNMTTENRSLLATFLLQHTYLVIVTTESLDSAFRIFSVLNDRGMDLTAADILKAEIIGKVPDDKQVAYTRKWEDTDERLGADDFDKLISYIVMMHHRQKMRETVLKTFRLVVQAESRPIDFIDRELLPYAEGLSIIQKQDWDGEFEQQIRSTLRQLSRIDNRDWVPPALMLIEKRKTQPSILAENLTDLERLAAIMWLNRATVNDRIDRYGKVIADIDANIDLKMAMSLQLSNGEKEEALRVIGGDIYNLSPKPKRTMILLRLDGLLGSGEAIYQEEQITIEHVLPQTPPDESEWIKWWPDSEVRLQSTHRLGNLALLNRRQNSAAKNWNFEKKKGKYFTTKGGASPFLITNEILKQGEWTPDVFMQRQQRYEQSLIEAWRLEVRT